MTTKSTEFIVYRQKAMQFSVTIPYTLTKHLKEV